MGFVPLFALQNWWQSEGRDVKSVMNSDCITILESLIAGHLVLWLFDIDVWTFFNPFL